MSKDANTYLNKRTAAWNGEAKDVISVNRRAVDTTGNAKRRWVPFAMVCSITLLLCLTINFRAYTEMSREIQEHQNLSAEIDNLTDENLALQEEIHNLKSDSRSIEREARKMGLSK